MGGHGRTCNECGCSRHECECCDVCHSSPCECAARARNTSLASVTRLRTEREVLQDMMAGKEHQGIDGDLAMF